MELWASVTVVGASTDVEVGCWMFVEVVGCPFDAVVVTTMSVLDTEFEVGETRDDSAEELEYGAEEEREGEPWGEEEVAWDVVSGFVDED